MDNLIRKKINFVIAASSLFIFIFFISSINLANSQNIKDKFQDNEKLTYKVFFNAIPSGSIEWEYLGKAEVSGREVDVLSVFSDTKIFKFLDLTSKEKVFLDSETYLPRLVERNVVFFGKKEIIRETYDQEKGLVKLDRINSEDDEIIYQDKPIHNILALLYFFPDTTNLEKDKWMTFNLPKHKIKMKMVEEKVLNIGGTKKDTYFLIGRGAKRFNLWLDKERRIPLRLEFITYLGKISIVKDI